MTRCGKRRPNQPNRGDSPQRPWHELRGDCAGRAEWPIFADGAGGAFVAADDTAHGRELFHTRGAANAVELVADVNPGAADANPRSMTVATAGDRNYLIFSAHHPHFGRELWRVEVPLPATEVTDAFVGSTAWADGFLSHLQSTGRGEAPFGYRILLAEPMSDLPWVNLNKISIGFSTHARRRRRTRSRRPRRK